MKTICITAGGTPPIPRYFLRSGLLEMLVRELDIRVVLLVTKKEEELYRREFGSDKISVAGINPLYPPPLLYRLAIFLSRSVFAIPFTKWFHRYEHYSDGTPWRKIYLKRFLANVFGRFRPLARIVQTSTRAMVLRVRPTPELAGFFEKYKPDLVFATSLTYPVFDVRVLVEARRRKIKTAAIVRNWDNLSNDCFLLFHPDKLLLQNDYLKSAAINYNFVKPERIKVVGFPHFDWYGKKEMLKSREEFFRSLGINPRHRLILYGAIGEWLPDQEVRFAEIFEGLAETGKIPRDLVLLFRAHPYFKSKTPLDEFKNFKHVIVDKVRAERLPMAGNPEEDMRDLAHFINSFYHSEMLVTPAGTVMLEATVFKKPIVVMAYNGGLKIPYWLSIDRVHDGTFDLFDDLFACQGVWKVKSNEEFAGAINGYLQNPVRDDNGRNCIKKRYVEPYDGRATGRLAEELISLLRL